jgi:hypothetical protein
MTHLPPGHSTAQKAETIETLFLVSCSIAPFEFSYTCMSPMCQQIRFRKGSDVGGVDQEIDNQASTRVWR